MKHHALINLVLVAVAAASTVYAGPAAARGRGGETVVEIRTQPIGAAVVVDDKIVASTPANVRLKRGRRTVSLKLRGYDTVTMQLDVGRKPILVHQRLIELVPPARLSISGSERDGLGKATLTVDGIVRGHPPAVIEVAPGRHYVQLKRAGYVTWAQWFDLVSGERVTVAPRLDKLPPPLGTLVVSADDPEAVAELDGGAHKGKIPLLVTDLKPGLHLLKVVGAAGKVHRETIAVPAGRATSVRALVLPPPPPPPKPVVCPEPILCPEPPKQALLKCPEPPKQAQLKCPEPPKPPVCPEVTSAQTGGADHGEKPGKSGSKLPQTSSSKSSQSGATHLPKTTGSTAHLATGQAESAHSPDVLASPIPPASGAVVARPDEATATADDADIGRGIYGLSTLGARVVGESEGALELAAGYPYWLEARGVTGFFNRRGFGLDLHARLRSLLTLWELHAGGRYRFAQRGPVAAALMAEIGGGGGPGGRSAFAAQAGAVGSLQFGGSFTLSMAAEVAYRSDRLCPEPSGPSAPVTEGADACIAGKNLKEGEFAGWSPDGLYGRHHTLRAALRFSGELSLAHNLNAFLSMQFAPGQLPRAVHSRLFNPLMPFGIDQVVNARAGVTFTF